MPPQRRCVGCGRIAPKTELLRIALAGERDGSRRRAIIDRAGTLPGRGAYLCRDPGAQPGSAVVDRSCLRRATRRRAIPRALRSPATLDPELVESPEGGEDGRGPESRTPLFLTEP